MDGIRKLLSLLTGSPNPQTIGWFMQRFPGNSHLVRIYTNLTVTSLDTNR
jgi:hypothetical protein